MFSYTGLSSPDSSAFFSLVFACSALSTGDGPAGLRRLELVGEGLSFLDAAGVPSELFCMLQPVARHVPLHDKAIPPIPPICHREPVWGAFAQLRGGQSVEWVPWRSHDKTS